MAEPALDAAIYSALTDDATLAALVGSNVYKFQGPQGIDYPYVIYFPAGGGEANETPRRMIDTQYVIKVVTDSNAQAIQIDSAISEKLHKNPDAISMDGWTCYSLNRGTRLSVPVENIQGVQVWHEGAYYRFRLAKDSLDFG